MAEKFIQNRVESPESLKEKEIMVAVSEPRGDNVLDPETIKKVDLIELKFLDQGLKQGEHLVHLLPFYYEVEKKNKIYLNLGDKDLPAKVQKLNLPERVERVNPRWLSLHFGWSATDVEPGDVDRYEQISKKGEILNKDETFKTICDNIKELKRLFKNREILLENLDYAPDKYTGGVHRFVADPDFMKKVLEETNTGLLLDLEHAYVSARNKGMHLSEYLKQLPLEKVKEIHLTRPSALKRSQRLKEMEKEPTEKDLAEDVLVDVHRSLVDEQGTFVNRLHIILKSIWDRMPELRVVTLEANLSPNQLNENLEIIKQMINKIKQEKNI